MNARMRIAAMIGVASACLCHATVDAQTVKPPVMSSGPLLDIIRTMRDASWQKVNTNRFQEVWTPDDQRPLAFSGLPYPEKIISAWSGYAWDTRRGDLIIYGGGHGNYSGNDVYRWRSSTLQWERAALPSEVAPFMGTEAYIPVDGPDNAPPSAHTYDNNIYLPIADRFLTWGGATFQTGNHYIKADAGGTGVTATGPYLFDPAKADGNKVGGTTGSHVQRVAPYPEVVGGNMWANRDIYGNAPSQSIPQLFINGCSGYAQENDHDVVYVAASTSGAAYLDLYRYEMVSLAGPTADLMSRVGSYWGGIIAQGACAYDADRNVFVRTGVNDAPLGFWNLATPGVGNQDEVVAMQGSIADLSAWLTANNKSQEFCGLDYDPVRQHSLLWCGDGVVWSIRSPTPASDLGWTAVQQPDPPAGSAMPPGDVATGILGKWKYIPGYDVFIGLENSYDGNIWVFRPAGWTDPQQASTPPTVGILTPTNGASFTPGSTITLAANANSTTSSVTSIEFYDGSILIGAVTSLPYTLAWSPTQTGIHTITARANDAGVSIAVSVPIAITVQWENVALAANGAVASSSSTYSSDFPATGTIDGDRRSSNWGAGGGWNDATANLYPDWLQVTFNGQKSINEIDVFTVQDTVRSKLEPTATTTFTEGGITSFEVQYWNGSAWTDVPGGNVAANNLVWRKFTFAPVSTDRIRVLVNSALAGYSRITEVEAWSAGSGNIPPTVSLTSPTNGATFTAPATVALAATAADSDGTVSRVDFYRGTTLIGSDASAPYTFSDSGLTAGTYTYTAVAHDNAGASTTSAAVTITVTAGGTASVNVALAANGGVATASSSYSPSFLPASAINGDRKGLQWGAGGGWNDVTASTYPDWLQVTFSAAKTIGEIDVFTLQDNFQAPAEPTSSMTFTQYGITSFEVQYWNGSAWTDVPGGNVAANNLVWRKFTFAPVSTDRIRVLVNSALAGYSRITEVEAW